MKLVNCYDCSKELKFVDAKPLWNRLDGPPDFLCDNCAKQGRKCDDKLEIATAIAKAFLRNNQPERSKREDRPKLMRYTTPAPHLRECMGEYKKTDECGALNSQETD